jgi:hypothetical protein
LNDLKVGTAGVAGYIKLKIPFFRPFEGLNQLKKGVGRPVGHRIFFIPKANKFKGFRALSGVYLL